MEHFLDVIGVSQWAHQVSRAISQFRALRPEGLFELGGSQQTSYLLISAPPQVMGVHERWSRVLLGLVQQPSTSSLNSSKRLLRAGTVIRAGSLQGGMTANSYLELLERLQEDPKV